jgi:hypothetical protein
LGGDLGRCFKLFLLRRRHQTKAQYSKGFSILPFLSLTYSRFGTFDEQLRRKQKVFVVVVVVDEISLSL